MLSSKHTISENLQLSKSVYPPGITSNKTNKPLITIFPHWLLLVNCQKQVDVFITGEFSVETEGSLAAV